MFYNIYGCNYLNYIYDVISTLGNYYCRLNTHAVQEPFVIATHRQLSVLHPIHKLLVPHYKDTMFINAFARQVLVNGDGLLEQTHFQSEYAMELSSHIYKEWNFREQALPADLIKR